MKYLLMLFLTILYSCHSTTSKKEQDNETDSIHSQKMEVGIEMKKTPLVLKESPKIQKNKYKQKLLYCNLFHVISP